MQRLKAVNPETATGKARELLDRVQDDLGMVPNLIRTLANSPAALEGYLGLSNALANGALPARLREQIALTVSEANGCGYCLAAHSAVGRMVGLSEEDIADSRRGASTDSKSGAALRFARQLVEKLGDVSGEEVDRLRKAGYSDGEIAEIVAHVGRNIFTNYFNHVAGTAVDYPAVSGPANS